MKGGRRRKHRKSRSSRSRRGGRGDVAANAAMLTNGSTSGTSYVNSLLGNGIKQWENVFVNGGDVWDNGNQYTLADNTSIISQADILAGGKRRRKARGKRGGYWGNVVNNALVPFGLWGAQYSYAKRRKGSHGTRKAHARK